MDAVRGVAIGLVLVHHGTALTLDRVGFVPDGWRIFDDAVAPFRMPLLMFLSGMLLSSSLSKPVGKFFAGKLSAIYWPYLVWSIVTMAATGTLAVSELVKTPVLSPTYLWYLLFLFQFYCIAWVCQRVRLPLIAVASIALLASAFLPEVARMPRFAFLLVFFIGGHLASQHLAIFRRHRAVVASLGFALAAVGAVLSVFGVTVRYEALYVWVPAALCLAILAVAESYRARRLNAPLEYVGRRSIVFYVTHLSVQSLVISALVSVGVRDFTVLLVTAVAAAGIVGWIFVITTGKWPATDVLFRFPTREKAPSRHRSDRRGLQVGSER